MKGLILSLVALVLLAGGTYWYMMQGEIVLDSEKATLEDGSRTMPEGEEVLVTDGKLKAANFAGTLTEVNTGCYSDGECYIVVDGKHITTTMGWSTATVGSTLDANGAGVGLDVFEKSIGKQVEAYVQDEGDGTYTLYGSEGFYVKLR